MQASLCRRCSWHVVQHHRTGFLLLWINQCHSYSCKQCSTYDEYMQKSTADWASDYSAKKTNGLYVCTHASSAACTMSVCRKAQQIELLTILPRKQMVCMFVPMQAVLHVRWVYAGKHNRLSIWPLCQENKWFVRLYPCKQCCTYHSITRACRWVQRIKLQTFLPFCQQNSYVACPCKQYDVYDTHDTCMQLIAADQAPDLQTTLPTKQLCCIPMQIIAIMLRTHAGCNYVAHPCRSLRTHCNNVAYPRRSLQQHRPPVSLPTSRHLTMASPCLLPMQTTRGLGDGGWLCVCVCFCVPFSLCGACFNAGEWWHLSRDL